MTEEIKIYWAPEYQAKIDHEIKKEKLIREVTHARELAKIKAHEDLTRHMYADMVKRS